MCARRSTRPSPMACARAHENSSTTSLTDQHPGHRVRLTNQEPTSCRATNGHGSFKCGYADSRRSPTRTTPTQLYSNPIRELALSPAAQSTLPDTMKARAPVTHGIVPLAWLHLPLKTACPSRDDSRPVPEAAHTPRPVAFSRTTSTRSRALCRVTMKAKAITDTYAHHTEQGPQRPSQSPHLRRRVWPHPH